MTRGSTLAAPKSRRRPVQGTDHVDPPTLARCTKDGRPWHPLDEAGRTNCPECAPRIYRGRHR